jgi:hypothetical protein
LPASHCRRGKQAVKNPNAFRTTMDDEKANRIFVVAPIIVCAFLLVIIYSYRRYFPSVPTARVSGCALPFLPDHQLGLTTLNQAGKPDFFVWLGLLGLRGLRLTL